MGTSSGSGRKKQAQISRWVGERPQKSMPRLEKPLTYVLTGQRLDCMQMIYQEGKSLGLQKAAFGSCLRSIDGNKPTGKWYHMLFITTWVTVPAYFEAFAIILGGFRYMVD